MLVQQFFVTRTLIIARPQIAGTCAQLAQHLSRDKYFIYYSPEMFKRLLRISAKASHEAIPHRIQLTEQLLVVPIPFKGDIRSVSDLFLFRGLLFVRLTATPVALISEGAPDGTDGISGLIEEF
jgi:hypothetical protein